METFRVTVSLMLSPSQRLGNSYPKPQSQRKDGHSTGCKVTDRGGQNNSSPAETDTSSISRVFYGMERRVETLTDHTSRDVRG